MTKALIIEGGIAGAVTAMAFQRAGIESVVYEAYPTGADDIGAFLTIMRNGDERAARGRGAPACHRRLISGH